MEPKFRYDEVFAEAFMAGFRVNDSTVKDIVQHGILDSVRYSRSGEFADRFEACQDTIDTQVDMFADLLNHACKTMISDFKEYASGLGKSPEEYNEESLAGLLSFVRLGYTQASLTEVVSLDKKYIKLPLGMDSLPLGLAYIFQRVEQDKVDLSNLCSATPDLQKYAIEYVGKLGLSKEFQEQLIQPIIGAATLLAQYKS